MSLPGRLRRGASPRRGSLPDLGLRAGRQAEKLADAVSVAPWSASIERLEPGRYEFRARTVDRNGFAQPEPRPFAQRSGLNGIQCKRLRIEEKA